MDTQELAFESVNLATYNPRVDLGPEDQEWRDIEQSLEEFGQVVGMVWNRRTGNVVGGHQRIRIMRQKGKTKAFFTVVDIDADAEKRLNIALNKITGRWENTKLTTLLGELRTAGLDIERLGFKPLELQRVLGPRAKRAVDPDATPPGAPAVPLTQPGDLYEFRGDSGSGITHRLICGDCRDAATMGRLMQGDRARLIFTDPPYNVGYDNSQRGDGRRPLGTIENDQSTPAVFRQFLEDAFREAAAVAQPTAALYTFHAFATHTDFVYALTAAGWQIKQGIIWVKHFALSRADYHWAHEPLMFCHGPAGRSEWFGPRTETTAWDTGPGDLRKLSKEKLLELLQGIKETADVWHEARLAGGEYVHPCQKPTGLARRAIINSSVPGEIVLDMFAGSGSTMISAELEDRQARLCEVDPGNCDVIADRWRKVFPGGQLTRHPIPAE